MQKNDIMRLKCILLPLLLSCTASAQLTITSSAELFVIGDMQLTLHNTDLINNGVFSPGVNTTSFTGEISSSIGGNGGIRFFQLEVNKAGNRSLVLQRPVSVADRIIFTSGFFDLNGFNTELETTGQLDGEREESRVIGSNGGRVIARTILNGPANANPGRLGAFITSTANLGNVTIIRGHQSQTGNGLTGSLLRYYDILSANNIDLNADLRISYFDGELNSVNENSLTVFKTENGINWIDQGFTSRDPIGNAVTKSGINSFSRWTLSDANAALPVLFILFNAKCEGNKTSLTWKTAQEQNTDHFDIERSSDGINWSVIGNIPATGNSNSENTYSFTDNNPLQNNFYRIAVHDLNGRVQFTNVIRSSCSVADQFTLWPNPVHDNVFINITSSNESMATIMIFDSKGAMVKMQKKSVFRGNNQFTLDIGMLANGIYTVNTNWSNGQLSKAMRIVKL